MLQNGPVQMHQDLPWRLGWVVYSYSVAIAQVLIQYFSLVVTIVTTSSIMGYVVCYTTDLEYECAVTIEAALSLYSYSVAMAFPCSVFIIKFCV